MKERKPKLPQKGGGRKAAEVFEHTRKKQPSDELVKIISEISDVEIEQIRKDRAAKEAEI